MGTLWTLTLSCLLITLTVAASDNIIPKQMRQLYKQYKRKGIQGDGINTVRYISSHKGALSSQAKLLFDLDALRKQEETLIKAELHFYRRSVEVAKTLQIDAFEISPYYISLVQRQRLRPSGKGWQLLDITDTVKRCTNTITTNNKLGLTFSEVSIKNSTAAVPVNMAQFLRHHGLPFILLHSNNTRTLEMDQITDHMKLSKQKLMGELGAMINPKTGRSSVGNSHKKYKQRRRRDVVDNKVDLLDVADVDRSNVLPTGNQNWINVDDLYNELTNKIEVHRNAAPPSASGSTKKVDAITTETTQQSQKTIQYIPWPSVTKRKRKRKNKNGASILLPKKLRTPERENKGCKRKALRINFGDIGWDDRIIEPKKIDAYYCTGACNFPHSYGQHLTNHATLQSLITSIQTRSPVPQPCCVPKTLQPVTLMFYDEDRNIVLKSYPDMSVESCECR